MLKIKNMYSVADKPVHKIRNQHKHGNDPSTKSPSRPGLVNFLFFHVFICLLVLMVSANVWAIPSVTLSVIDTKGNDSVFNGEGGEDGERLRITISVSEDIGGDTPGPYDYVLEVDGHGPIGPSGATINANETKTVLQGWDGRVGTNKLLDGTYTIRVEIRTQGRPEDEEPIDKDEASATLDTTAPEVSIGVGDTEILAEQRQIS